MTNYIGNKPSDIPLTASDIPDLPTSKITSGTFASSYLVNAVTDLQPIKSDISALALREATNESSASFNLPNQFIDTFATDTLGTKTNVSIDSGSVSTSVTETGLVFLMDGGEEYSNGTATMKNQVNGTTNSAVNNDGSTSNCAVNTSQAKFGNSSHFIGNSASGSNGNYFTFAGSSDFNFGTGDFGIDCWLRQNTGSGEFAFMGMGTSNSTDGNFWIRTNEWNENRFRFTAFTNGTDSSTVSMYTPTNQVPDTTWTHVAVQRNGSAIRLFINGVSQSTTDSGSQSVQIGNSTSPLYIGASQYNAGAGWNGYIDALRIFKGAYKYWDNFTRDSSQPVASTTNATGTAIQNTNTVGSAKTEVGGTFLYKDNSGTATIGTDLKIYFTCNGGSNWTEASSYNAITPVYSTGIKQVRLGKTTCTSGTDVRYKAVWSNQASGSKDTQLHGIGINY